MPQITSKKSRRSHISEDDFDQHEGALRSAQVSIAALAATDEEFAAGIPLRDPGSILSRKRGVKSADEKPPNRSAKAGTVNSPLDQAKAKAAFKRLAERKKNTKLLASKSPTKKK